MTSNKHNPPRQSKLQEMLATVTRECMRRRRIGYTKVAKMTGLSDTSVYRTIYAGQREMGIESIALALYAAGYTMTIEIKARELTDGEQFYFGTNGGDAKGLRHDIQTMHERFEQSLQLVVEGEGPDGRDEQVRSSRED